MGNDRAFTVARNGSITWSWNGSEHLGTGSEFDRQYGSPGRSGPESDWTRMNDIDRLPNWKFQLSIRDFDVVIEVDPETDGTVDVIGRPGDHEFLYERHNPNRLTDWNTLIVADSEKTVSSNTTRRRTSPSGRTAVTTSSCGPVTPTACRTATPSLPTR